MNATEFNIAMAQLGLRNKDLAADTGLSKDYVSLRKCGKAPISRLLQRYLELRLENAQLRLELDALSFAAKIGVGERYVTRYRKPQ